jgi:UDP-glucose 4-epimerase
MRVLVTGGAGYVGSVVVEELLAAGAERVLVLDDLSKGHAGALVEPATLVRGDIGDAELVQGVCRAERIEVVVHMAARSLVGESVAAPAIYYDVNLQRGLRLIDAMLAAGVRRMVFSSTAAVYGAPAASPITEEFPTAPESPYGETKLAFERALGWYQAAYGLRWASLRYFTAAGATPANGEQHDPESHLVPNVLAVARGAAPAVKLFGDDYPTPDGTCVRDYIHVSDLARAHVLAIPELDRLGGRIFNLGCGGGHSVAEVIETARAITGHPIPIEVAARRPGDPPVLVASSERIRQELGWEPRHPELRDIVASAWEWLQAHPAGYR